MIKLIFFLLLFLTLYNGQNNSDLSTAAYCATHDVSELALNNRYSTGEKYLTISNIKSNKITQELTFEVSWDSSWRMKDSHDAAWIFIKMQSKTGIWQHFKIRPGSVKILKDFSLNSAEPTITMTEDGIGFMIYRNKEGAGDNHWQVAVDLSLDETNSPESFRVMGLEMVYVADGAYELGTLKGEKDRREVLTPGAGGAPYNPFFTFDSNRKDNYGGIFKVSSEEAITIGKEDGNLFWLDANIPGTNTFSGTPEGRLERDFPKGTQGFYQMKYELSQQEYCDFLNTLTLAQQTQHDLTKVTEFNRPIADYRNAIVKENGHFNTNHPNRPCNFISWIDGLAYADWAGLRHMTELEFEKACRGSQPAIYRAYVWGVNEIEERSNMEFVTTFYSGNKIASKEDGSETVDGNIHASMFSYRNFIDVCTPQGNFYDPKSDGCRSFTGGDQKRGPVRKGIFGVTSNGDRVRAAATYYGAMEMGGNLQEPVVTVGHPSGRKFRATHGNGELTAAGFADNEDWQPIDGQYAFGGRGGCWKFHENHARTADRFKGLRTNPNRRASHIGFRGVRGL
ncbi:MAG: SUMF1/EgtB/PvdO family nonheme iron enzyme [Bacteroidota bacterium]